MSLSRDFAAFVANLATRTCRRPWSTAPRASPWKR